MTVPKAIQHSLGVQEGDRVAFIQRGDAIVRRPLPRTRKELRGTVPVCGPQDFDALRAQVVAEHGRNVATDDA